MITEANDKKNGTRDQKGRGKNGRPNLLEDEEYQKLGHYDFSMFTKEDRAMYKTILEAEPYDWKLMKFFHEQKREATRMKKQDERHRTEQEWRTSWTYILTGASATMRCLTETLWRTSEMR